MKIHKLYHLPENIVFQNIKEQEQHYLVLRDQLDFLNSV